MLDQFIWSRTCTHWRRQLWGTGARAPRHPTVYFLGSL